MPIIFIGGVTNPDPRGTYDVFSKYLDFVSNHYETIFVSSAGNRRAVNIYEEDILVGTYLDYSITSPAVGYNVITVGATLNNNLWNQSNYKLNNIFDMPKPNLVADGYDVQMGTGTSFAAPKVVSAIARLISHFPHLRGNKTAIFSILFASCNKHNVLSTFNDIGFSGFESKVGAGMLDFNTMYWSVYSGRLASVVSSNNYFGGPVTLYSNSIYLSSNQNLKVSVTTLKRYGYDVQNSLNFTNYQIRIYRNGTLLFNSRELYNFRIVYFNATQTGSYELRLVHLSSIIGAESEKVSLAYQIYN